MTDYIKREDAYQAAGLIALASVDHEITCGEVKQIMNKIPSADVLPVIRGKWEKEKYPLYRCSKCGAVFQEVEYGFNYCPNCGAKMEVDNEN